MVRKLLIYNKNCETYLGHPTLPGQCVSWRYGPLWGLPGPIGSWALGELNGPGHAPRGAVPMTEIFTHNSIFISHFQFTFNYQSTQAIAFSEILHKKFSILGCRPLYFFAGIS